MSEVLTVSWLRRIWLVSTSASMVAIETVCLPAYRMGQRFAADRSIVSLLCDASSW